MPGTVIANGLVIVTALTAVPVTAMTALPFIVLFVLFAAVAMPVAATNSANRAKERDK